MHSELSPIHVLDRHRLVSSVRMKGHDMELSKRGVCAIRCRVDQLSSQAIRFISAYVDFVFLPAIVQSMIVAGPSGYNYPSTRGEGFINKAFDTQRQGAWNTQHSKRDLSTIGDI